ncbi:hypothetical protein QJQ45_002166 [Haematococcus lacustris]|nr:hypothetical protein QJQ45_002166 [Haematococcus lacustris]
MAELESADWVVLTLDPSRLTAKVVFEAAAPVGATPTFTTAPDAAPANPVAAAGSAGAAAGEQAAAQAPPPAIATTAGSTVEQAAAVVGGASSAAAGEQAESKPVLFPHLVGHWHGQQQWPAMASHVVLASWLCSSVCIMLVQEYGTIDYDAVIATVQMVRDKDSALNMQRIGESKWRPLELCYWPDQGALPAKGKEYPGLGYKRLRDKPPKAQQQQAPPI